MTLEHVGLLAPRRRSPENDDVFYLRQKAKEAQGALAQLRRSLPQKIAAATQRLGAEREAERVDGDVVAPAGVPETPSGGLPWSDDDPTPRSVGGRRVFAT